MPVKDTDRAEFEAFHDLGFDSDGREVLVGLSYEETEWYLDVLERDRSGPGRITKEEIRRRSDLANRHTAVRLQIAEAAVEASINAVLGRKSRIEKAFDSPGIHPGAVAMARESGIRNEAA
jgi:hypothetical protein